MIGPRIMVVSLLAVVCNTAMAQQAAPSHLLRTLTGNREPAKQHILSELEQDSEKCAQVVGDLIAAVNALTNQTADASDTKLPETTIRLIQLIGSIPKPAATEALVKLLDTSQMEIVMVSAESLGQNDRLGALPSLIKQTERPEFASAYAFRFGLLRAIARIKDPESVEFLTQILPQLDGQLAYEVYTFLDQVTLSHFQGYQSRFDKWNREAWPTAKEAYRNSKDLSSLSDYGSYSQPTYYGLEIHSIRLVFLLDRSSSMVDRGRLQQAKHELIRAIQSLPDTTEFAIIVYETTVRVWRTGLVEANIENKRDAVRFIKNIHRGHDTNIYGALNRALDLEYNIEAVFLVSDGAPTTGKVVVPDEIIRAISRQNRFRHIKINTVGISIEGPTEEFMRELAVQNGGEYRAIR